MHVVDTHALSGPALATARRAAHLQQRGQGGRGGDESGRGSDVGILRALHRRLGLPAWGIRVSRRARRLLVGASLACGVVLCTLAIIGSHRSADAAIVALSPPSSSSSFGNYINFGLHTHRRRRALLQTSSSSPSTPSSSNSTETSSSSNSTETSTNTAGGGGGGGGGGSTTKEEEQEWGNLSTIITLGASVGSAGLGTYNKLKLEKAEYLPYPRAERKEAEKLAKKKMMQLQMEHAAATQKRETDEARKDQVDNLMTYYKKPMLAAVFDLQSRLKNMIDMDFLNHFMYSRWEDADKKGDLRESTDKEYALYNTLYLFGELFGWMEVIRKEIVFLHGRWPTPAANELLDAIRFQFSGETPIQGSGMPRYSDVVKFDAPEEFCKTHEDFKKHRDAWKKSKGMKLEHTAAFSAKPDLASWMKSKLDPFENFRYGEEQKAKKKEGAKFDSAQFDIEMQRQWKGREDEAAKIDEDIKAGTYFSEQWEENIQEVFGPYLDPEQIRSQMLQKNIPKLVVNKIMEFAKPLLDELEGVYEKLRKIGTVVTKEREQQIIHQKAIVDHVIAKVREFDNTGTGVGEGLAEQWENMYSHFYELEQEREKKLKELEEKRRQLVQVHKDEVKKWNGYVYHTPGEHDRLQLYAGEMRSIGEVLLIERVEDSVTETNLMPCGYNEFLELMTMDTRDDAQTAARVPYEELKRAKTMQRAFKKFKGDLEHIAKKPEDAPKQRLVVLQSLLCKLIDVIDPEGKPGDPPPLVKRDFRLKAYIPVTPAQEGYLNFMDKALDDLQVKTDRELVEDVQAVTMLETLEQLRKHGKKQKEKKAGMLLLEKGEDDDQFQEAVAATQNVQLDSSDKMVMDAMRSMLDRRMLQKAKKTPENKLRQSDIQEHVELSNSMDTIEKYNMKAGELERLKLAKKYMNAQRFIEENQQKNSPVPQIDGPTLQKKGQSSNKMGVGPTRKFKFAMVGNIVRTNKKWNSITPKQE